MCKKRIGITQKIMKHPHYDEVMNCLDLQWYNFLHAIGFFPILLPTLDPKKVPSQLNQLELDGIILSGGNSLSACIKMEQAGYELSLLRDNYELSLIKHAIYKGLPLMGVCRGLQLLNHFYGGNLVNVERHVATRHAIISAEFNSWSLPKSVNSYHEFGVTANGLGGDLVPLAYDNEGLIEAFCHNKDKILAIMWHPERESIATEPDLKLTKQFFTQSD